MSTVRNALLFLLGGVLALLGLESLHGAASSPLASERPAQNAQACTPTENPDEIFFVTCGGIY